jgi:hypothetical protein
MSLPWSEATRIVGHSFAGRRSIMRKFRDDLEERRIGIRRYDDVVEKPPGMDLLSKETNG